MKSPAQKFELQSANPLDITFSKDKCNKIKRTPHNTQKSAAKIPEIMPRSPREIIEGGKVRLS